ncbi:hypothetical protein QE152_g40199 [Popillia japonica]|uniref:HTH psq-type domain-containing protein n=1 Tax=Popillia japonica TaxID=7064 RepID=A0AAW1HRZ8_POPJA
MSAAVRSVKMQKQSLRGAVKEFGVHVTTLKNYCDRSNAILRPTSPTSNFSSKLSLLKAGHDISINILACRKPTSPTSNFSSKLSLLKAGHDISINILACRKRKRDFEQSRIAFVH